MAVEQRYERQVRVQATTPRPMASPESYGAGLGRSIEGIGSELHRRDIVERRIERDATRTRETTEWSARFARWREEQAMRLRELRGGAAAGAAGHAEAVRAALNEGRETLLDGFTEDSVSALARQQLESWSTNVQIGEADWADVQRIARTESDWVEGRTIAANRSRRLSSMDDFATELEMLRDQRELLDLNQDQKAALSREDEQALTIAFLQGAIERDPVSAKAMLGSPLFDDVLEPGQVEALLNGSEVEIRRLEAAQARQAAEAEAAVRESIATLEELNRQGIEIPEADLAAATRAAGLLGDTSLALKLDGIRADNAFAKIWGNGNATPLQREQRMIALAGLDKRTPEQDRELNYLRTNSGPMDSAFEGDPVRALAAQEGAPALDWADPASIAERARWAAVQSRATGRIVPVASKAELGPLQDMLEKDGGTYAVLEALDQVADPAIRVETARLIAPSDPLFQRLATVEPLYRPTIRRGEQALTANKAILTPADKSGDAADLLAGMRRDLDRALRFVDPEDRQAIIDTANNYLAGRLDRTGRSVDELPPEWAQGALAIALGGRMVARDGANVMLGGLGRWGGEPFAIEDGYSEADLKQALWNDVAAAEKIGLGPVNRADGSKAKIARATPVLVGPGRYQWYDAAGGVLVNTTGAPFVSRVEPR